MIADSPSVLVADPWSAPAEGVHTLGSIRRPTQHWERQCEQDQRALPAKTAALQIQGVNSSPQQAIGATKNVKGPQRTHRVALNAGALRPVRVLPRSVVSSRGHGTF